MHQTHAWYVHFDKYRVFVCHLLGSLTTSVDVAVMKLAFEVNVCVQCVLQQRFFVSGKLFANYGSEAHSFYALARVYIRANTMKEQTTERDKINFI